MKSTPHVANRETSSNSRAETSDMFSSMLSEMRGFGEGFIIAEQIPSRLVEDAIKNTNVKIVHRLPGKDDREVIGATMNLGEEQEPYLSKLSPGESAIFMEGFEKPTFVRVEDFRRKNQVPERITDIQLEQYVKSNQPPPASNLPYESCFYCKRQCNHRERISGIIYETNMPGKYRHAIFEAKRTS